MWIRRISISSFGSVKDFYEELKDKMTVVYGLNEAGKSTIAEFIRTTLFPNRSRSTRYPIDDKSDCGYIEIQMDNEDTRTLKRKNKKVREKDGKKTFYEEMKGFDLQTYGSIYGLNLKELSNNESTSAKRLKDRILETMGGENVPGIRKQIEYKLDSLMNKERRGNKPIDLFLQRREEISWAREKIKSELSRYDEKIEEKKRLEDRIKKGKAKRREKEALRIVESNRENVERYKRLMEEYERDVEFSKDLLPRDLETYDRLNWEIDNISKKVNSSDNVSVIKEAEKIDEVWKNRDCYLRHLEDIEKIESDMDLDKKEIKEIEEITGWKVVDVLSVDDVDKIDKETKREIDRRNKQVYRFLPYFGNSIMVSVAILMGILLVLQVNKAIEIPALLFGGVYLLFGSLLRFRNEFLKKKWLDYIKFKG
ncbi:MAG: AAA family ATPase, partial [archaeon]|nr:AAA family ATPase [archaeon]